MFFIRIVFKWSISKWNVLKSQHILKPIWRMCVKVRSFNTLKWNFWNCENVTKCWFRPIKNGWLPFRPILSVIGTRIYKLAKLLVPILFDTTRDEFTIKDSFTFVDKISTDKTVINASLDVDILFTNTSLDETIGICVKKLLETLETLVKGIPKDHFSDLLTLTTKEWFLAFNKKFYIQVDCVAMGSRLGSILVNIFLSHHEQNWLKKWILESCSYNMFLFKVCW